MIREPFLAVEGIHNFRDYGGWPTEHGGTVRTGLLWRSGQHVEATDADLVAIAALGIRTVVDLRGNAERTRNPCRRVDGFDGEVVFYDGETSSSPPHMDVDETVSTAVYARERMVSVYSRMARNPAMIEMFARYFRVLADRDGASLVHCFAGKDRTGVAAMLVLHVLGVNRADQMAEFLRTNQASSLDVLRRQSLPGIEERLGRTLDEPAVRALLQVDAKYLETYWDLIESDHGSLDDFIAGALGVDDAMRERLKTRLVA